MSTLLQLKTQIKFEARVEGDASFDEYVVKLINELLITEIQSSFYPEALIPKLEIAVTANGLIALPEDFLILGKVHYKRTILFLEYKLDNTEGITQPAPLTFPTGPNRFEILKANKIQLYPTTALDVADKIQLWYYAKFTPLVGDADIFPIVRAEAAIVTKAVARLHIWHNRLEQAAAIDKVAVKTQTNSDAINNIDREDTVK